MSQITWPFPRPYFEAGNLTDKDTGVFPVSVDGREYLVDTASGLYRRFNVDVLKTRQNRTADENLLVEPEVWRAMVESWHQGAGQTRQDREDSLPYRYFASKNIDPWRKWGIELLHETDLLATVGADPFLVATSDGLAVIDGTTVTVYDETLTSVGTATLSGTALDVASDGKTVYVLSAGALDEVPLDTRTVTSTVVPAGASMVGYLKGFIVLAVDNALYDFSTKVADPTTLISTAPLAGHRWVDATDGLAAGYLLGGQGDKWHVYWITVRDDAATLNPPVVAAPLPEGEIGYSLGSYLGFVLVGTERGIRFCTPAGDNTLTYGRLIVTDAPVVNFEGQDRFVWFGIGGGTRDFEEPLRQPEVGLARLDLSVFTAPLTPAYSADLIGTSSSSDVSGKGRRVVTWQGKRVFTSESGEVFHETDNYAVEGWLTQGVFNQGVRDKKIALYGLVSCEPLPGGAIETTLADDSTNFAVPQIQVQAPGSVTSGNVDLGGLRFDGMTVQHTLRSSLPPATPRLTRFEFRSVPVVGKAHEWQVPLLIFGGINWKDATYSRDAQDDVEHLLALVETGRLFEYREGSQAHTCYSPGYEWRPEKLTEDGQAWQGVFVVRVRSIR